MAEDREKISEPDEERFETAEEDVEAHRLSRNLDPEAEKHETEDADVEAHQIRSKNL